MKQFLDLEARIADFKTNVSAGKTIMALHNSLPSTRIQTSEAYLGSMLKLLGFENVNEGAASSNAPIDMETMMNYTPDYIFCVSSIINPDDYVAEAIEYQKIMEEGYKEQQEYWDLFDALVNGDVFYLSSAYRSSLGIGIIADIHALMDMIETHVA